MTEFGVVGTYKMNKRVHLDAFARRVDRDRSGEAIFGDESFSANLVGVSIRIYP